MQGEESGGLDNYYYSFDYGGVHFVQTCSEAYAAPYETGSVQYEWLRNVLFFIFSFFLSIISIIQFDQF